MFAFTSLNLVCLLSPCHWTVKHAKSWDVWQWDIKYHKIMQRVLTNSHLLRLCKKNCLCDFEMTLGGKSAKCEMCGHRPLPASGRSSCTSSPLFFSGSSTGPLIWGGSPFCPACMSLTGGRSGFSGSTGFLFKGLSARGQNTQFYNPASEQYTLRIVLCVMTEQISLLFKYLRDHKKVRLHYFRMFNAAAYVFFILLFDFAALFWHAPYTVYLYRYISSLWKIWATRLQLI